jgi:Ser/Thr protein kinase RdoA (MazF antagonist)
MTAPPDAAHLPPCVIDAWGLHGARIEPITIGHINLTYKVAHSGQLWVLQRLSRIFAPEVNLDIAALGTHLRAAGVLAPELQPLADGRLWHTDPQGHTWRLMTFLPGEVFVRCDRPELCQAAGAMLGRFHRALAPVTHTFAAQRFGVHDTPRHLRALGAALQAHRGHVAYDRVAPLAEAVLEAGARSPDVASTQPRIVHGDPKISNFIFASPERAVALIDLDTLAHMPIALELGDALRSWCSPGGEDPQAAGFVLAHFEAALRGYRSGASSSPAPAELEALPDALSHIALELTARFACDALEERYFGWDKQRFSHAWAHNLERARSQWILRDSYLHQRAPAAALVRQVFGLTP